MMEITREITATRKSGLARLIIGVRRITNATGFLVGQMDTARKNLQRFFGRKRNRIYPTTWPVVLPPRTTMRELKGRII